MRAVLVALSMVLLVSARLGGQTDSVRLANRSFVPRPGIDSAVLDVIRASRSRVHVLVQLDRSIADTARLELDRSSRLRVTQIVSSRLHIASIDGGPNTTLAVPAGVRWIGLISPRDKLGPGVPRPGPAPASRGSIQAFVALFHTDVAQSDQRAALQRHGATRIGRIALVNGWVFTVSPDSIAGLAGEDVVNWIEQAPVFGGSDNDVARSSSGINADAVLTPSLYGLSGGSTTLAYWDGSIPFDHIDFGGRMTNADGPPIPWFTRNVMHTDNVLVNEKMDPGETLYIDIDDSRAVTASIDRKANATTFAILPAGTPADQLVYFNANERFFDRNSNSIYEVGEPIYDDADNDHKVSAGETLLAGNAAAIGDALVPIPKDFHWHSTMVIGSMIGDGGNSESGSTGALAPADALQWKGIAPSGKVLARSVCKTNCFNDPASAGLWAQSFSDEHVNALATSGLSGFVHPWGPGGCHTLIAPPTCYLSVSSVMDALMSNRNFDGTSALLSKRVLAIASSGNDGYPERHTETVPADGRFQAGEAIYKDVDGDGLVGSGDELLTAVAAAVGEKLVDFAADEKHVVMPGDRGRFRAGRGIYRDADGLGTVNGNDVRLEVTGLFAPIVGISDPDVGQTLAPFVLWGNVQMYMSAKNTLQVGAVASDIPQLPAFSSRGPTRDGRLKPDLVAPGTQMAGTLGITSTYPRNGYGTTYGTSMSTGIAAGAVSLLNEWYRVSCGAGASPSPELTRALLVHGADDVVDPALWAAGGPDYASGFGRLRVKDAVDLAQHHVVGSLPNASAVYTTTVTIPRTRPLKVTLAWSDPAWNPAFAPGAHGILNNDLDLVLVAPDGKQYAPWILDPSRPALPATRTVYGIADTPPRDTRNTIEQVVVDDAIAGTWTIRVTSGQMNYPAQSFVLVGEAIPPSKSPCVGTPSGDVWVRDNPTDIGTMPSSGIMWLGPDLWNRNAPDGASNHQNPEYGQPNYLYATVRNRGATVVASTTVELWLGEASTGLVWPTSYTYVGRIVVPQLGPGEARQVGPLEWTPPATGHYCMYMRLFSAQDPLAAAEGASITANARNNNNIAYRNLNVVDLQSTQAATFFVRNVDDDDRMVDLTIRVPAALLTAGTVDVTLAPGLLAAWTARTRPTAGLTESRRAGLILPSDRQALRVPPYAITDTTVTLTGFRLRGRQAERVTLTFASAKRDTATFNVDVEQRVGDNVIGGIRYVVRTGRRR
jgi:hypothetical protein